MGPHLWLVDQLHVHPLQITTVPYVHELLLVEEKLPSCMLINNTSCFLLSDFYFPPLLPPLLPISTPTPSFYQDQQTLAATEISGTPVNQVPPPVGGPGGIITPQGADLQGSVYATSNHDGTVNLLALSSSSYPLPNSQQHHRDSISGQSTMMESMEALHAQVYRQLINISNF